MDAQRERALSGTDIKLIMPPCPHGRQRSKCKECGGGGLCEHGRRRSLCKECGGGSICEHGRRRSLCKECGGGSICEHGRRRYRCKDCGGSIQETVVLDATAVEVDEDAESDIEWIVDPQVNSERECRK